MSRAGVARRDIEDVVQEAHQRIWEKREQIDPSGNVTAWENRVALNQARSYLRQPHRREVLTPTEEGVEVRDERADPEACAILRSAVAVLRVLISQIDPTRAQVFVDHELREKTLPAIAAEQGISLGTAKKRLRLAWEDVDRARTRWQAEQRRRGFEPNPAVAPLLDIQAWPRRSLRALCRCGPRLAVLAGTAALVAGSALPITWSPFRPVHAPRATAASTRETTPDPSESVAPKARETAARSAPRPAPPPNTRSSYSPREDDLVGRARAALDARQSVEAHRLLEAHAREFPNGRRRSERDALLQQLRRGGSE